jgi:hypothetical protein
MATRRLRIARWHHQRVLRRQALAQEGAAAHLTELARTLEALGRNEPARCLAGIALRFRVKATCLTATAGALHEQQASGTVPALAKGGNR